MDRITEMTLDFFDARTNNFWHWAENGEVVEWQTGTTLCYKAELWAVLRGLSGVPVPHLGAVMLGIAACSDNWRNRCVAREILHKQMRSSGIYNVRDTTVSLDMLLHNAFETLDVINGVVKDLRSESMRIHLLRAVFENIPDKIVATKDIETLVERFNGMIAHESIQAFQIGMPINFLAELEALQSSVWRQKGSAALEQYLLTNLVDTPKPDDIAPLPEPETEPLTLMEELLKDDKTEGLARLTQRLSAAIHIPMHAKGSSDQPFGGFSDITNRGNLDRLLLSELAQDDDTLTARLVNNEAMYLRREEPPSNIERERTILLDTTIQLWGLPRVFALAAALACAEKKQHISRIQAFALRGEDCETLDLTTKKGVVEALGQLDFHWHCGVALRDFLLNTRSSAAHDIVFVTDAETLKTPDFQPFIAEAKRFLTYLIVVNRVGALQVFDLSGGRNKSLGNATFDLADLLFPTKKPRKKKATDELFTPLFYDQKPLPLFYLPTGVLLRRMRILQHPSVGVVNITNAQRVLRWRTPESGAEELLPVIEEGEYCMGFGNILMLYIVVSNEVTRLFKFYKIDIRNGHVESHDFTGKTFATVDEMAYYQSHVYLKNGKILDCREATMSSEAIDFDAIFQNYTLKKEEISLKRVKQFIKNRNSPLLNPTAVFINTRNELIIDKFSIQMKNNNDLVFRQTTVEHHAVEEGTEGSLTVSTPFDNPSVLFFKKKWPDGSIAAVDSRGFWHLKSSNPTIPEITIIPNLSEKVTAWASNGQYCGNPYYLSVRNGAQVPVVYFFKTYIQGFIHHIIDA